MWSEALHPRIRLRLSAHATRELREGEAMAFAHPLARRMTPLQKSLVEAARLLSAVAPEAFRSAVLEAGCPVIFATAYGELGSNLGMLLALRREERPVSPTSFQHSVHNCAVGYLSIAFKLRNPMSTLSAGFLSNEKALQLAAATLAWQGNDGDHALVLCADEVFGAPAEGGRPPVLARAQALLIERVGASDAPAGCYLETCAPRVPRATDAPRSGPAGPADPEPTDPASPADVAVFDEAVAARAAAKSGAPGSVASPLPYPGHPGARIVRALSGETLETRWTSRA